MNYSYTGAYIEGFGLISIRQFPPPPFPFHEKRMYSSQKSQIISSRTVCAAQTECNVM